GRAGRALQRPLRMAEPLSGAWYAEPPHRCARRRGMRPPMPATLVEATGTVWRSGTVSSARRTIPEEVAVAVTYGRTTHAVMMATPADLEDFAIGFSLTEGIVTTPDEITGIEPVAHTLG